jgi:C4-type Zn-finger protein
MLRANQVRKRTHAEVVEDKANQEEKLLRMNENLQKLQKLEEENQKLQAQVEEHQGASFIINDLQSKGKLHFGKNGSILVPGIDVIPEEDHQE